MYTEPTFERKTSTAIAHKINAKMKECWSNSIQAMRYLPPDAVYVEGWAVAHQNQIIEHGWCQINSRIIDVTLFTDPGVIVYFPGILYSHKKLIGLLSQLGEDEKLPFILNSEKYELNGTIYRFAYEAANKYIMACQKEGNKQYCTASQLALAFSFPLTRVPSSLFLSYPPFRVKAAGSGTKVIDPGAIFFQLLPGVLIFGRVLYH